MRRLRYAGLGIAVAGLSVAGWLTVTRPSPPAAPAAAPMALESPAPITPDRPAPSATPSAKLRAPSTAARDGGRWPERLGGTGRPRAAQLPPGSKAKAQPYTQPFAAQPGTRPLARKARPKSATPMPPNTDGCDHNYGTRVQCVPWTFPDDVTDKCAWLTGHGYRDLKVVGRDRQKLDPDGDETACD
ncbi:hypothetical protein [Actinoplanes sp. NPDC049265]|uniref:hypothetical protein n=1 Tax=Actinoplanes sp. NPDC049265 TaxID=3363902 RepID=UPI003721BEF4